LRDAARVLAELEGMWNQRLDVLDGLLSDLQAKEKP
jgi:hypothetical protein